jgi:hypothetical protein
VCDVPFDLTQITLGQFISYQSEYGKELDKKLKEILEKKYEVDADYQRELELEDHLDLEALCWYSYWTKHDLHEVKNQPFITPLLEQYRVLRYLLKDDDAIIKEFPASFDWKGEEWIISDFKVNPANEMSFNEIITSKEVMRQVHAIGGGRWDAAIYLCAVYCRKKGETFSDKFIQEGSERMELLKELPLKYALSITFFLSVCVNIWLRTLAYSRPVELETPSLN